LSADCFVIDATESTDAVVSSRLDACSDAPDATACDDDAICAAADDTWSTACATCARASCNASPVAFTDSLIFA
jgi:hypothetical protein